MNLQYIMVVIVGALLATISGQYFRHRYSVINFLFIFIVNAFASVLLCLIVNSQFEFGLAGLFAISFIYSYIMWDWMFNLKGI